MWRCDNPFDGFLEKFRVAPEDRADKKGKRLGPRGWFGRGEYPVSMYYHTYVFYFRERLEL